MSLFDCFNLYTKNCNCVLDSVTCVHDSFPFKSGAVDLFANLVLCMHMLCFFIIKTKLPFLASWVTTDPSLALWLSHIINQATTKSNQCHVTLARKILALAEFFNVLWWNYCLVLPRTVERIWEVKLLQSTLLFRTVMLQSQFPEGVL